MKGKRFIGTAGAITFLLWLMGPTLSPLITPDLTNALLALSGTLTLLATSETIVGTDPKNISPDTFDQIPTRHERALAHIRIMEKELGISDPYAEYYR